MSSNASRARPEPSEILSTTQIAAELGVSVYTVRRLIREGRIRRLGGIRQKSLVTRAALDDYLRGEDAAS